MLDLERLRTLEQVRAFVEGNESVDFKVLNRESIYDFVSDTLKWFRYRTLGKHDKGLVLRYLEKATGRSRAQTGRLVRQYRETGRIRDRRVGARPVCAFQRVYTRQDILLLAELDKSQGRRCALATRATLRRMFHTHGDNRYERLWRISNGHLYNLRATELYRYQGVPKQKTKSTSVAIAVRAKPCPNAQPGYLRVDTVHQGDRGAAKGVYHINIVDEVTQFQFVGCVEAISERFLIPVLEDLLTTFPFRIQALHADNGSEYINHQVARLLRKLDVEHFTKSRAHRCNDNALVESKNACVVRKHFGHEYIPRHLAPLIHPFSRDTLSHWVNFHRTCLFAVESIDHRGRRRRKYTHSMTPYEKLKSLEEPERFLKPGLTFEALDKIELAMDDVRASLAFNKALLQLFRNIEHASRAA